MARGDDAVDAIREQWLTLRPDLDLNAMEVAARLSRAAALVERETGAYLGGLGLSRGEFDVLTALCRAGAPQSPGSLRTVTLVSAAAITKRVAALQQSGLIQRSPNPADGRGALISLTADGLRLVDQAFPEVLAIERRLLAGLSPAQHARAVTSLRQILASAERTEQPG
jgi:DNA-binding MarR family transcriptional regulator